MSMDRSLPDAFLILGLQSDSNFNLKFSLDFGRFKLFVMRRSALFFAKSSIEIFSIDTSIHLFQSQFYFLGDL